MRARSRSTTSHSAPAGAPAGAEWGHGAPASDGARGAGGRRPPEKNDRVGRPGRHIHRGGPLKRLIHLVLPLVGISLAVLAWWGASVLVPDLPSPLRTWDESRLYILEPFVKRGETDQGIAR